MADCQNSNERLFGGAIVLEVADGWSGSLSLLRGLDKYGCATALIPPNPGQKAFAGIWIAKGGCMCGGSK